jgi:hypothetical protein
MQCGDIARTWGSGGGEMKRPDDATRNFSIVAREVRIVAGDLGVEVVVK